MRDAAVDVGTERTLIIVERLARLLGPHQGFKVGADGGVNVYPSSLRVRLPAEKQEAPPRPAKRDSRSGCPGDTRAPNARTRRSAARAATHAQRRAQAEDRLQLPAGNLATARCGPPFELQPGSSPGAFERASAPGTAHRGPGLV